MAQVLIAAAGTGGHLYPALALAGVLGSRGHGVFFAGGDRLETKLVPEAGYPLARLPGRGLPRSPSPAAVAAGFDLAVAFVKARKLLKRLRTDVVVGMGGYQSVAPCVAAGTRGLPVVLHEQNGHLALAHRLSMRWATVLATSVPLESVRGRRGLRVVATGNPLRDPIRRLAASSPSERERRRRSALERFGLDAERVTVLAFGGSLGAKPVNEALLAAARGWGPTTDVQVVHITGADHAEGAGQSWRTIDVPSYVTGYLDDIQEAYAAADLVACRSGGAVAEVTALGLPSVLVPGPWATGGHQEANARWLASEGAAEVVSETEPGFAERFAAALGGLLDDPGRRRAMSEAARRLGRPDASEALADAVESVLGAPTVA